MLTCPHCQFENPDSNKFCQHCGTSLIEVACSSCEAAIPTNLEYCPFCGAPSGMVWRAIVSVCPPAASIQPDRPDELDPDQVKPVEPTPVSTLSAKYLDADQRYQLLDSLPQPSETAADMEARVLDCQPFQPSPLALLLQVSDEAIDLTTPLTTTAAPLPDARPPSSSTIPAIAQPYLALQSELHRALPQIHDAWEQPGQTVVVLEERADLPLLTEVWSDSDLLTLQILHWMHEMVDLWAVLQPYHACRSLLELNNLRVDEDQLLCLQRLYIDAPDQQPQIKALGRVWRLLFELSQRTQLGAIALLCAALETGEIVDVEKLYDRLESIANQFQTSDTPSTESSFMLPEESQLIPPTMLGLAADTADDASSSLPAPPSEPLEFSDDSDDDDTLPTLTGASISPTRLEASLLEDDTAAESDDIPTVVLPMKLIQIEDAGRTDVGRQRDHNEDFFTIQTEMRKLDAPSGRSLQFKGLYVLCDGMGGHAGGEVASSMAAESLKEYFQTHWTDKLPSEEMIREAIQLSNKAIYDLNQASDRSGVGRMGTTLLLLLIQDAQLAIAHVGDSRLYRFSRRRGLEQVTTDHEVGQREIQRGVEATIAYARPDAYQLTQALGPRDENFVHPDVQFLELNEDVLLMLCSDGLTDNDLLEIHWQTHVEPLISSQVNLEQGVNQLIDLANHFNGHDNITTVAIRAKVRPNLELLKR